MLGSLSEVESAEKFKIEPGSIPKGPVERNNGMQGLRKLKNKLERGAQTQKVYIRAC